eukprot:c2009_g1_i1.p1 GENE.c2009_g1_i1~~c2009_g1_i1.p1  ORF type:complete len:298 (+),score=55.30 c2009_g1_i1:64-957(+)
MTVRKTAKRTIAGKFLLLEELGQGSFANVYTVQPIEETKSLEESQATITTRLVAKVIRNKTGLTPALESEIKCWKLCSGHPNIVRFHAVEVVENEVFLLQDHVDGQELFDAVLDAWEGKGCASIALDEHLARTYFFQILQAIQHIHACGVAHRDIKPENILVDFTTNSVKLIDFGFATTETLSRSTHGTLDYTAPEILRRHGFDPKRADIWSCGVVLFVMLTGRLPFSGDSHSQTARSIAAGYFLLPAELSPDAKDLISQMLQTDPCRRATIPQLLTHRFFRDLKHTEWAKRINADF